ARNPAAPPWEGPLTPFGDAMSDANTIQNNTNIQWEILAMRPYGGTPIAGMLDDANEFLFLSLVGPRRHAHPRLRPVGGSVLVRRLPQDVRHPAHRRRAEPRSTRPRWDVRPVPAVGLHPG